MTMRLKSKRKLPELQALFEYYNTLYFADKLRSCHVEWSSERMTSTAGNCRYSEDGECLIRISEPLHRLRPLDDLKTTLLHEMIHASMFIDKIEDRDGHGPEFKRMMHYINEASFPDEHRPEDGYSITVFHEFEDEAEYYRRHWWKCEKCGNEVKRSVNRKPQEADCAKMNIKNGVCCDRYCPWHQHLQTCGGEYMKVKEPPQKPKKALLSSVGSPLKRRRKNKPTRYSICQIETIQEDKEKEKSQTGST